MTIGTTAVILDDSDIEVQDIDLGDEVNVANRLDADGHVDGFISSMNATTITERAEYRGTNLGTTIDTTLALLLGKVIGTYQVRSVEIVCEQAQDVKISVTAKKFDSNTPTNSATSNDFLGYDLDVATIIGAHGPKDVPSSPAISNSEAASDLVKYTVKYTPATTVDRGGSDGENFDNYIRGGMVEVTHEYIGVAPTLTATGWTFKGSSAPSSNRDGSRHTYTHTKALSAVLVA